MTRKKMIIAALSIACILFLTYKAIGSQNYSYLTGMVCIVVIFFFKKRELNRVNEQDDNGPVD
ncbi:hypothetical protein D3H55_14405 [Bacillus salacetis]|uniref:Uncharacterized protein n=1 Tax=Bacillus salacetis TaxID=2315464 RepID=A0A3A1QV61_9BACI|nr:hypothetical protein [Bacillus salacetis]RIW32059.1 hypothetical protein D3H55_14405 [Bacillus salacetis]